MKDRVISYLEAIAREIGNQDEDTFVSFYKLLESQLQSEAERKALAFGTLAMIADYYKLPLRRAYYTFKFKRALKRIPDDGRDDT